MKLAIPKAIQIEEVKQCQKLNARSESRRSWNGHKQFPNGIPEMEIVHYMNGRVSRSTFVTIIVTAQVDASIAIFPD